MGIKLQYRQKPMGSNFVTPLFVLPFLTGCGGGGGGGTSTGQQINGFPSSYSPPDTNYLPPVEPDPYFSILESSFRQPYWVDALTMDQHEEPIENLVSFFQREIKYVFPSQQPQYEHFAISGWEPATDQMKIATREILEKFQEILDVSFVEGI